MLKLYSYYRSSASYRVRLSLAHKQVPFELVTVPLRDGSQQTPAHLEKNPMGQVPVLEIPTAKGPVYLSQSLAILEYLDERYPELPLLPQATLERARARELSEIVNAGIQPLQNLIVVDRVRDVLQADPKEWTHFFVRRGLVALEQRAQVTAGTFLVGDHPSIADVCLVPQLYWARRFDVPLDGLDTLLRVDARAVALPRWDLAHPDRQPDAEPPVADR